MSHVTGAAAPSGLRLVPDMPICQQDLPLDWYQDEFKPYAAEYLALPDRTPRTVLPWMDGYIRPALDWFGPRLLLLAHYYMGGEIVKLVERYGGRIADSYELALQTVERPDVKVFVESAVHFMAESIAILAAADQQVWITNPKSGCTLEMLAKDWMVEPAFDELVGRYGEDLTVVAYMNTSGRVKALAGRSDGSVCTSSNAKAVVRWALARGKKVFFVPDRHLGENVAASAGLGPGDLWFWGAGAEGGRTTIASMNASDLRRLDSARMILWGSFCGVHTVFRPEHVSWWRERGYRVLVHPECPKPVVDVADGSGSTKYLWSAVMQAASGAKLAIGTEGHFCRNAREQGALRGVEVVNLADVPDPVLASHGCGCATMSRNDPPHLVAILDLLRQGRAPDLNRVLPGDVVNETTGSRDRLSEKERAEIVRHARRALERMIEVTRNERPPGAPGGP
jgi:quinolinate synthase